jgi:uncharacterized protein YdaU (DUF1376 family)
MADDLRVWFPLYVADILTGRKTRRMDAEQIGIFMLLLCEQWIGGPLPTDHEELSDMGRAPWEKVEPILQVGFVLHDQGWVNERLVEIWVEQDSRRKVKSRAGKAGAEARWGKRPKLIAAPEAPVGTEEDGNRIPAAKAVAIAEVSDPQCDPNGNESIGKESIGEKEIIELEPKKDPVKNRHAPEVDVILIRNGLNWKGKQHPPKRGYCRIPREDFEDVMWAFEENIPFPENLVIETQEELNAFFAL